MEARVISTEFFHVCFKLCSYYKHSNLLVACLRGVQSTYLVGPQTEIFIHVHVCSRCITVVGFPEVE